MEKTITKTRTKVEIDQDVKNLIKSQNQEERQIIIHCTIDSFFPTYIRIWPTTYYFRMEMNISPAWCQILTSHLHQHGNILLTP